MRKVATAVLIAAATLAAAVPVSAATIAVCTSMIRFDVDSTTPTSCRVEGTSNNPCGPPISGPGKIKSAADPSATVQSNTAASGALAPILVNDILYIRKATTVEPPAEAFDAGLAAVVTVKTDADTVTVDPTVSWAAGYSYSYEHTVCGTTDAEGWIDTANASSATLTITYEQGDLDNLSWQFQCRANTPGSIPVIVYPSKGDDCGNAGVQAAGFCDFATAGATASYSYTTLGNWGACRIVFKRKTTDTSDAGANLERVTGTVIVRRDQ